MKVRSGSALTYTKAHAETKLNKGPGGRCPVLCCVCNSRSQGIVVDLAGLPMTPQLVALLFLCTRLPLGRRGGTNGPSRAAANGAPMPSHEAYVAAGLLLPAPWRSSAPLKCQDQDPPTAGSDVPMQCHGQRSRPYNLGHLEPILPVTLHPPHNASSDFPHLAFHGGSVHIRPIEHALVYSATALCCADTRPLHRAL